VRRWALSPRACIARIVGVGCNLLAYGSTERHCGLSSVIAPARPLGLAGVVLLIAVYGSRTFRCFSCPGYAGSIGASVDLLSPAQFRQGWLYEIPCGTS
jgi:hypothetical protein